MPRKNSEDFKKRFDPYDPRTGATGNDEPTQSEGAGDMKHGPEQHLKRGERVSPGSGEDKGAEGAADLQPEDVEHGDTAR